MNAEPTLTEALSAAGYTHAPAPGVMRRAVLREGVEVFVGTSDEAWGWLRGGCCG